MISHLLYYQRALLALLWLFVLWPLNWPRRSAPSPPGPATPIKPQRKRATEPKACEGLTHKPPGALCERETGETPPAPPPRPAPRPPTHRRPRPVDTSRHFWPHPKGDYRGGLGMNKRRAHGHPNGGPWRQLPCTACEGYVPAHHGTIFHGQQAAVELIVRVVACLAEGLGIRATARVFEVAPNTGLSWLVAAAEPLRAFSAYFLCDLHLEQLQLDALYAGLRALKAGARNDDEAISRLERGPSWVWTAMAPTSQRLVVVDIGSHTLARAHRVGHQVGQGLAPGGVPLCLTDGCKASPTALLTHCGQWVQPARRQTAGPRPQPRWRPLPPLLYAQVITASRRRRLVDVTPRVVFGTGLAIAQVLARWGGGINTAVVERRNRDIRQRVAAIGRRGNTLWQGEAGVREPWTLFQVSHNFVLPHASVRQPLPQPEPTNGTGAAKQWWPGTPAMAAGWTEHVWSRTEVHLYRLPPWPQPQTV